MKSKNELIAAAKEALEQDDYYDLYDVVYEVMSHISDLNGPSLRWRFCSWLPALYPLLWVLPWVPSPC